MTNTTIPVKRQYLPQTSNSTTTTTNHNMDDTNERIKRRRLEFNGHSIRIPKDSEIDEKLLEPFKEFYPIIADEFKHLNIQTIIEQFEPILDEFYELSEMSRRNSPKYNEMLEKLIDKLTTIFKLKRTVIYVRVNSYTTTQWGNVYWLFMHYASILLSYAYSNGLINDYLDFPSIVYNIDEILPCPMCKAHYLTIKQSPEVKATIKTIAFGMTITGLIDFHNIITSNVDQTLEYMNQPKRSRFTMPDFVLKYKCVELPDKPATAKIQTYIPKNVDWQSTTHAHLTIILAIYCPQLYLQASCTMKNLIYANESAFNHMHLLDKDYNFNMIYNTTDLLISRMTKKQIIYCIVRALLLQLHDTLINENEMKNNKFYNNSIIYLYRMHPQIIRKLVELNMPNDVDVDEKDVKNTVMHRYPSRRFILNMLEKISKSPPTYNTIDSDY